MPGRLFVLDVIQHQFINLSNLSLTEKQKSLGGREVFYFRKFPTAFQQKATFLPIPKHKCSNVDQGPVFVYRSFAGPKSNPQKMKVSHHTKH